MLFLSTIQSVNRARPRRFTPSTCRELLQRIGGNESAEGGVGVAYGF
jgi:hypothetical protein